MFHTRITNTFVLIIVATCSSTCAAALMSINDTTFGANSFTRDTATGLEWLDINFSDGMTFQAVSAQLGAGGKFAGLRHATAAELDQFMKDAGINPQAQVALYNYSPVQNFESLVGGPTGSLSVSGGFVSLGSFTLTHGITSDVTGTTTHNYGGVMWTSSTLLGGPSGGATATYGSQDVSTANSNIGHWLVRVPEPAGGVLVILGLVMMATIRGLKTYRFRVTRCS